MVLDTARLPIPDQGRRAPQITAGPEVTVPGANPKASVRPSDRFRIRRRLSPRHPRRHTDCCQLRRLGLWTLRQGNLRNIMPPSGHHRHHHRRTEAVKRDRTRRGYAAERLCDCAAVRLCVVRPNSAAERRNPRNTPRHAIRATPHASCPVSPYRCPADARIGSMMETTARSWSGNQPSANPGPKAPGPNQPRPAASGRTDARAAPGNEERQREKGIHHGTAVW